MTNKGFSLGVWALFVCFLCAEAGAQPAAPTDIRAWGLKTNKTKITWKDNANDETEYRVERSTNGGGFSLLVTLAADSTSHTDSGFDTGDSYRYRVKAFRNSDMTESAASATVDGPQTLLATNFRGFFNTNNCPPYSGGEVNCVPNNNNGMGQNEYTARMLANLEGSLIEFMDFGFNAPENPEAPDPLPVNLKWCDGGGCAGGCGIGLSPWLSSPYDHVTDMGDPTSLLVAAHELFHMIQFSYNAVQADPAGSWFIEAQARAIQDLVCTTIGGVCQHIDNDPNGVATFVGELNGYLGNPNRPITELSYGAAMFWAYMCDHYGAIREEPHVGLDFLQAWWDDAALDPNRDGIQVTDSTLANLGFADRFDDAFQNFIIANYTKQLAGAGVPFKYKYTDEAQVPGPYDDVRLDVSEDLAVLEQVGPFLSDVQKWGARYHEYRPDPAVPFIQIDYSVDSPYDAYFILLAIKGGEILVEDPFVGKDFERSIANDEYDMVTVIVSGLENDANFRYVVNGVNPVIRILDPLTARPAIVGDRNAPDKFLTKLEVLSPTALPIEGIDFDEFSFRIGAVDVTSENVVTSAYIQGQYWFVVQAPVQAANTTYDFVARWNVLSDTETNAISYMPRADADNVLVIDRSGSMGAPASKLQDAKAAGKLYVDSWREGDMIGVTSFECVAEPVNLSLRDWSDMSRDDAHDAIDLIAAFGGTAIGTGLDKGMDELLASGDPMHNWALILLSDGLNTCGDDINAFYNGVYKPRADGGMKVPQVHTVAIGADANRPDLQTLASNTGGTYHFAAEPGAKGPIDLDTFTFNMAEIYRIVGEYVALQDQVLSERGVVERAKPVTHSFNVDKGASELVAAVRWQFTTPNIKLFDPEGIEQPIFKEIPGVHRVYRIGAPKPGVWQFFLEVPTACQEFCEAPYLVEAGLKSTLQMDLFLGLPVEERMITVPMPILVSLTDTGPIPGASVQATVRNPADFESTHTLFDDGAHGDGAAGDGIYGNTYYGTNLPGSYKVTARAEGDSDVLGPFDRIATEWFNLKDDKDDDKDGLPDTYEERTCLLVGENDSQGDKDGDKLSNLLECQIGTDPCDPDTDDGGEADGSEYFRGADPFDPSDDRVRPPRIRVIPGVLRVFIRFNVPDSPRDVLPPFRYEVQRCDEGSNEFFVISQSVLPAPPFEFIDSSVELGKNYKYRIVAFSREGEESVPSETGEVKVGMDPYPPHGAIFINMGEMTTDSTDADLLLPARDDFDPESEFDPRDIFDPNSVPSGVQEMMVSNESDGSDSAWEPYSITREWVLEPNAMNIATVFVKYRDGVGNESVQYHASIRLATPEATATPTVTLSETPIEETPTPTQTEVGPTPTVTPTCQVPEAEFDLDENNEVNARDLMTLLELIHAGALTPDFNCDGILDGEDLFHLSAKWKKSLDQ